LNRTVAVKRHPVRGKVASGNVERQWGGGSVHQWGLFKVGDVANLCGRLISFAARRGTPDGPRYPLNRAGSREYTASVERGWMDTIKRIEFSDPEQPRPKESSVGEAEAAAIAKKAAYKRACGSGRFRTKQSALRRKWRLCFAQGLRPDDVGGRSAPPFEGGLVRRGIFGRRQGSGPCRLRNRTFRVDWRGMRVVALAGQRREKQVGGDAA